MKKILVIISLVLLMNDSRAQDEKCDAAAIMNVKGIWKKVSDANMKADKNLSQITSRIDAISKMYQAAYNDPKGMQAAWYRTMEGEPLGKNGPVTYRFNSLYKAWYCNQYLHKMMLGSETGTWSFVYINNFGWFMTSQFDKTGLMIENEEAYLLPKKIGEWKGLPLYQPSASNDGRVILITRDNQLPYKPVTRLEFLQSMKKRIEDERKKQVDVLQKQMVRTDAEEEIARQTGLSNIEKNNKPQYWEQRKASYLKNYKTDEQRKQESIRLAEEYFDKRLRPIIGELNNESSTALQQPAFVDNGFISGFKQFSSEENGGRMLVLTNPSYLNAQLPRYVPQFIAMYWGWEKNSPAQYFKEQFESNFPIDKLKAMIDK